MTLAIIVSNLCVCLNTTHFSENSVIHKSQINEMTY